MKDMAKSCPFRAALVRAMHCGRRPNSQPTLANVINSTGKTAIQGRRTETSMIGVSAMVANDRTHPGTASFANLATKKREG